MDPKFIEKAEKELRETDLRKSQALEQMREWIAKTPYLEGIRTDDVFLLQHLRVRKFNVGDAFKSFERALLSKIIYPQHFGFDSSVYEKNKKLIDSGFFLALPGRSEEGCKQFLFTMKNWNPDEFSVTDMIQTHMYIMSSYLEEEETQIAGVAVFTDVSDSTMKHMVPPSDAVDVLEFLKNSAPVRHKANVIFNMPSFFQVLFQLAKSVMSEKLQKRLHSISVEELKNFIDVDILPEDSGGKMSRKQLVEDMKKFVESKKDKIDLYWNLKLDVSKIPPEKLVRKEEESMGSFRKLEID